MWKSDKKPEYGDQIRVNRGIYYHHGIYESDDVIYQFASPEGAEISPKTAKIIITTLDKFLKGGSLEVKEYNSDELEKKRTPEEIIEFAKSKLGYDMGGYNLASNNCEHFSNLCVFGEKRSEQVEGILSFLGGLFKNENRN